MILEFPEERIFRTQQDVRKRMAFHRGVEEVVATSTTDELLEACEDIKQGKRPAPLTDEDVFYVETVLQRALMERGKP